MARRKPQVRAPQIQEIEAFVSRTPELPWVAACWAEESQRGGVEIRWSLDRRTAPTCARTHLLAGRALLATG